MEIEFLPGSVRPRRPWVTWGIVAACAAWSLAYQASTGGDAAMIRFGFGSVEAVRAGEVWRLMGNLFFNSSLLWLGVVGFSVLSTGPFVERFFGPLRFAGIVAGATLAGGLAACFVSRAPWSGMGAVLFGTLGATLGAQVQNRHSITPSELAATYRWFILWTAVNAALVGFLAPIVLVQYAAAAGAGVVLGLAIPGASTPRRPGPASAVCCGLLAGALLLSVAFALHHAVVAR